MLTKPVQRFTSAWCDSLRPSATAKEYTDPSTRGLQLRVSPSGAKTWLYRFKIGDSHTKVTLGAFAKTANKGQSPELGMTLEQAREAAHNYAKLRQQDIDPRSARQSKRQTAPKSTTSSATNMAGIVADYLARYLEKKTPKSAPAVRRLFEVEVLQHWGHRNPTTIKPSEVVKLLEAIVDRGAGHTATKVQAQLSKLFRWTSGRLDMALANPVPMDRIGADYVPRSRILSDSEIKIFLSALPSMFRNKWTAPALRLLLLTGQRRGELAAAKWTDVKLDGDPLWTVPAENSKNGMANLVPLSPAAVDQFRILATISGASAYVLPCPENGNTADSAKVLTRNLARAEARLEKLGISKFTVHDLRRTCRTGLGALRVPAHIAERVLAHKQRGIIAVYDLYQYGDEKREALNLWATKINGLTESY